MKWYLKHVLVITKILRSMRQVYGRHLAVILPTILNKTKESKETKVKK